MILTGSPNDFKIPDPNLQISASALLFSIRVYTLAAVNTLTGAQPATSCTNNGRNNQYKARLSRQSILGPEGCTHGVGSGLTIGVKNMAVHIGGHAYWSVTQHFADNLELHSLGEHETRR